MRRSSHNATRARSLRVVVASLCLLCSPLAVAQDTCPLDNIAVIDSDGKTTCSLTERPRKSAWSNSAMEARAWGDSVSIPTFDVTSPDEDHEQMLSTWFRGRLDYSADPATGSTFEFVAESDFLAGRVLGTPAHTLDALQQTGTSSRHHRATELRFGSLIDPRALYVGAYTGAGLFRVGMMPNNWGLGLVSNSGARRSETRGLFNQTYGGDRAIRALWVARPFESDTRTWADDIHLALGADLVWRDDFGSLMDGDRAVQGVASLFYQSRDERTLIGAYAALRRQRDREPTSDRLDIQVLDAYAQHTWGCQCGWVYDAGIEIATLWGETTRARPQRVDAVGDDSLDVWGSGAAAELGARWVPGQLEGRLLTGFASGDADSRDDTLYRFRFDPNYKVGLVLFDHYLSATTRAGLRRATDRDQSASSPRGIENVLNDGGIENALYLNPQVIFGSADGLMAGIGVVFARAAQDLSDPYASATRGGAPTGVNGGTGDLRDLGWEVDVATQYRLRPFADRFTVEIKAEMGVLFPGEAFDDARGERAGPQSALRARLALLW